MTDNLVAFLRERTTMVVRESAAGVRAMWRALNGDPNPTMTPADMAEYLASHRTSLTKS